jgi:hypothetical protein
MMSRWVIIILAALNVGACADEASRPEQPLQSDVVKDAASAIRIMLDHCLSKNVTQPPSETMHATLHNGIWHVWEAGKSCEVVAADVTAADGKPGLCSICLASIDRDRLATN